MTIQTDTSRLDMLAIVGQHAYNSKGLFPNYREEAKAVTVRNSPESGSTHSAISQAAVPTILHSTCPECERINEARKVCKLDHTWKDSDIQKAIDAVFKMSETTFISTFGRYFSNAHGLYKYLVRTTPAG